MAWDLAAGDEPHWDAQAQACARWSEPAAQEAPQAPPVREVNLTPNFGRLFTQFIRDAAQAGGTLSASICAAQFDSYPEAPRDIARRAAVLRVVQGFLAPATIALQAATTAEAIQQLRDMMADTLATLDRWASEFEAASETEEGN